MLSHFTADPNADVEEVIHFTADPKADVKEVIHFTADPNADVEEVIMQYYETHLHAALRNRPMEVDYLRHLADRVFPYILPVGSMNCKYVADGHCQC